MTFWFCTSSAIFLTDFIFLLVFVGMVSSNSFTSSMVVSNDLVTVGVSVIF